MSKKDNELIGLLYICSAVVIILLSIFNLTYKKKAEIQVLGADYVDNTSYWQEMTEKYPTYIPAWLELGRFDKVKEIDPNYDIVKGY